MHKYLEYFEKIVGNETKEKELKNIVSETMEKIRRHCPEEFYCAMYKACARIMMCWASKYP